ncbi:serine/threonine protein kinase Sgk2 [Histoplasma capsulatum H143]|uniref:Serine/threonine protein kinase Sgk2 n=1 Tax=Ajellomyces capsulatus (strain H143) TaxID=544712 RepID=C6HA61_AJECH|nr:serine/threonine protein kinase Sgk2 [Histoplasma capsulatum H143]
MQARGSNGNWAQFSGDPTQDNVLAWWFCLQEDYLSESCGTYYTTVSKADLTGSKAEQQVDLLLRSKDGSPSQNKHDWRDILVVDELKKSKEIRTKATLLQIGRCVRKVFAAQPTQRFIHTFTVCSTKMKTWMFDHSGPYSSGVININEDLKQFFQVLIGYTMMSNEELGLDTFIARDEDGSKITVKGPGIPEEIELRLDEMLSFQHAIMCHRTTCFLADVGEVEGVAKFSWVLDKQQLEIELLKLAGQRNVQGVTRIIGHSIITSITDMKHRSLNKEMQKLKQSHSTNQLSSDTQPGNELAFSAQPAHKPSLFDRNGEESNNNCVLHCLVISPAGRPIYKYKSPLELLKVLHNAIKAHQSLYLDGNILHQDISENNIIITNPDKADGHMGMLINLDLAKEVGSQQSGARHQTGTMEFMAIEVLLNTDHIYQHDLKSFFYILIWQCAHHSWEKLNELQRQGQDQPKDSLLREWYTRTYKKIATYKQGNMEAGGFEYILQEFPPDFKCIKPLCRTIQGMLFPYGKEGLIVGTPQDPDRLYNPIIKAYDDAIAQIEIE